MASPARRALVPPPNLYAASMGFDATVWAPPAPRTQGVLSSDASAAKLASPHRSRWERMAPPKPAGGSPQRYTLDPLGLAGGEPIHGHDPRNPRPCGLQIYSFDPGFPPPLPPPPPPPLLPGIFPPEQAPIPVATGAPWMVRQLATSPPVPPTVQPHPFRPQWHPLSCGPNKAANVSVPVPVLPPPPATQPALMLPAESMGVPLMTPTITSEQATDAAPKASMQSSFSEIQRRLGDRLHEILCATDIELADELTYALVTTQDNDSLVCMIRDREARERQVDAQLDKLLQRHLDRASKQPKQSRSAASSHRSVSPARSSGASVRSSLSDAGSVSSARSDGSANTCSSVKSVALSVETHCSEAPTEDVAVGMLSAGVALATI